MYYVFSHDLEDLRGEFNIFAINGKGVNIYFKTSL